MKKLILIYLFLSIAIFSQSNEDLEKIAKENPILFETLTADRLERDNFSAATGEDTSLDSDTDDFLELAPESEEVSDIFGFSFFNKIPTSISSTSDLPVPEDYKISLGDKIKVILTGGRKDIYELEVDMSGSINFPELGEINIFGESIQDVRAKIKQIVELSYVGTNVSVGLGELSARKINIIGAVKNAGTYIVNPFSTISTALAYSGGFEDYASLREIVLIRNSEKKVFDLYDLIVLGNRGSDINVQQGDTILVNSTKKLVEINGSVNRPMKYEFKDSDKFSNLIKFAMGTSRDANISEIYAKILSNGVLTEERVSLNDILDSKNIVELNVPKKIFTKDLRIEVIGEGVTQRSFSNSRFKKLSEVIDNLEFSDDIFPFIAVLRQDTSAKIFKEKYFFSLSDPKSYEEIELKSNVSIEFFSRLQILEDQELIAEIFPSSFLKSAKFGNLNLFLPIYGKISLNVLVNYFGLDNNIDVTKATFSLNDGTTVNDSARIFDANNISALFVPEKNIKFIKVELLGLFSSTGYYELPYGATLEDLYLTSGGIPAEQEVSILMTRESLKETERDALKNAKKQLIDIALGGVGNQAVMAIPNSTDYASILPIIALAESAEAVGRLSGKLEVNSLFSKNLVLEDGDRIFANPRSNLVSIIGQVLNPVTLNYDPQSTISDYIELAGSYSSGADKKNIYIISSDGTSIPYDSRFFQKEIQLAPGDTIVVPRDFNRISTIPLVNSAAQIISNIAFAAASLNTLNN